MAANIVMPKLGMTMVEGTVKRWLRGEGQQVDKGAPVMEIETEKVVYEVEAPSSGIVHIACEEGSVVPCGGICGSVAASQEEYRSVVGESRGWRVEGGGDPLNPKPSTLYPNTRIIASPIARRLAQELGVDISRVKGTGPGGRIVEDDVRRFAASPKEGAKTIPIAGMRKTVAEHMVRSLQTSAQLTCITEVDATALADLHHQLMAEAKRIGARISHNDLIAGAVIRALKALPIFNSTVEGDEIKVFENVNLGIAVPLDDGVIVPVVHHADKLSLVELSNAMAALAEKARVRGLSRDDVTGGTFTVSNLSAFDVMAFTPIINSPESAILGIGGMAERPVAVKGQLAVRSTVYLCLTWDHRVADGVPAAKFLRAIKQILERPAVLLV